jgi:hypothetical protein
MIFLQKKKRFLTPALMTEFLKRSLRTFVKSNFEVLLIINSFLICFDEIYIVGSSPATSKISAKYISKAII